MTKLQPTINRITFQTFRKTKSYGISREVMHLPTKVVDKTVSIYLIDNMSPDTIMAPTDMFKKQTSTLSLCYLKMHTSGRTGIHTRFNLF